MTPGKSCFMYMGTINSLINFVHLSIYFDKILYPFNYVVGIPVKCIKFN